MNIVTIGGGGNTQKMLDRWQETGISEALISAEKYGTILSGLRVRALIPRGNQP